MTNENVQYHEFWAGGKGLTINVLKDDICQDMTANWVTEITLRLVKSVGISHVPERRGLRIDRNRFSN
jgi:hypothetical protein